jgi:hypothetical protein
MTHPAAPPSRASADRDGLLGAAPAADPERSEATGIVRGAQPQLAQRMAAAQSVPALDVIDLVRDARDLALPFVPQHMEAQCGFKLRGAEVESALAVGAAAEMPLALPRSRWGRRDSLGEPPRGQPNPHRKSAVAGALRPAPHAGSTA